MTYRGDKATISNKTSTLEKDSAFNIANLTMRKALDIITIVTGILMLGILGGVFFTYKYVTSDQFKTRVMNEILGNVQGMMPKVLDQGLPKVTGPSMPIIK